MLHAPPPRLCGRGCGAAKVQTYTIVGPHQIHHSALQTGKSIHFPTAVQGTYSQKSILLYFYSKIVNQPPPDWVVKQLLLILVALQMNV